MRHKTLITICAPIFLFVVFLGNPVFADAPGEGSHSKHEGMKMGEYEGFRHADGLKESHGHGKWHSHQSMGGHGFDPYQKALMCKTKLNLTSEQINEIVNQQTEFKKQRIRNRADQEIARIDFKRLLSAETLEEAKLQSTAKEIGDTISKQISATMNAKIALMKILTPEQRKNMAESHSHRDS